jgi:putative transposase
LKKGVRNLFVDRKIGGELNESMGRPRRAADGGMIYHVLNRGNARMTIFESNADYEALEQVLEQAIERYGTELLAWCLMPNHWHFVVRPHEDGELSRFVGWLTLTHTQRWHAHRQSSGAGHLYQGRFKSFAIQAEDHFLTVCRYVERNALRANLVRRAEDWRWSSLWRWHRGGSREKSLLAPWPVRRQAGWIDHVNAPQTEAELAAIRNSVARGSPYGDEQWTERVVKRLGIETTLRPRGRPRKAEKGS